MKKATKAKKKPAQPVFLDDSQMKILEGYAIQIKEIRNTVRNMPSLNAGKFKIDILSNDTIKTVMSWSVIKQYDPVYRANMRRNGIDSVSGENYLEEKNSAMDNAARLIKSGPNKGKFKNASWVFHAFHNDNYNSMILKIWDKGNIALVRLYDIRQAKNIQKIRKYLYAEAEKYQKKVEQIGKKATNDRVDLLEKFIAQSENLSTSIVDGVTVTKDW